MADSTTHLDSIPTAVADKAPPANALFDAASPATLFGRRASTTTALTWGFYGGMMLVDGVLTTLANGTYALAGSATNYIESTRAGVVSANTTGFTAGRIPLYTVVTNATVITSYTDYRAWVQPLHVQGRLARALATDANITLTAAEARNQILDFTSGVSLTVQRDVIVPLAAQQWTVFNNTTGGMGLRFIGATGTGVVVAPGERAVIYADGTNINLVEDGSIRESIAKGDANVTLSEAQARNQILEFTGAQTVLRDVIVPLTARQWTVFANTTGGFGVRFIGATGTGITVADGKRAIIYADGTNVVRATADV